MKMTKDYRGRTWYLENTERLKTEKSETFVIYGVLTILEWNRYKVPTRFSVFAVDEYDYPLICKKSDLQKLNRINNCKVKVKGHLVTNEFGDKEIRLKSINTISDTIYKMMLKNVRYNEFSEIPLAS